GRDHRGATGRRRRPRPGGSLARLRGPGVAQRIPGRRRRRVLLGRSHRLRVLYRRRWRAGPRGGGRRRARQRRARYPARRPAARAGAWRRTRAAARCQGPAARNAGAFRACAHPRRRPGGAPHRQQLADGILMRFDVVTLFPDMFGTVRDLGITGRAHAQGLWALHTWNPRDYTHDVHRTVDDRPYGGGPGMVMLAAPLEAAVAAAQAARAAQGLAPAPVALLSPAGRRYDQQGAQSLAAGEGIILICGRYEGVDQRFIDRCVTDEISLGDFVLSGG